MSTNITPGCRGESRTIVKPPSAKSISPAGTVSTEPSRCAIGNLLREISRPSARQTGDHLEQVLRRGARHAKALRDPPCFAVERHWPAAAGIEHHHPDGRGLDQGFESGFQPPLAAMHAEVGGRRCGLRREQHQHVLVLGGEEEVAQVHFAVAQRGTLEGLREHRDGFEVELADVARQVRDPQRRWQVAQVL